MFRISLKPKQSVIGQQENDTKAVVADSWLLMIDY